MSNQTHAVCNKRLKEDGGHWCCSCSPHDECEFTTTPSSEEHHYHGQCYEGHLTTPSPEETIDRLKQGAKNLTGSEQHECNPKESPRDWKKRYLDILTPYPDSKDIKRQVDFISDLLVEEREATRELVEAAQDILQYLEPSMTHDLMYRPPSMALREAADSIDRKESAIARLKQALTHNI